MKTLTCPIPADINPLPANGFRFSIIKLPEVSYFCQEANIPGLMLPPADFGNMMIDTPVPGEKLSFDDLNITFMVDSQMANFSAIYGWMVGLGFPETHSQYTQFVSKSIFNGSELSAGYSDAVLEVLGPNRETVRTIYYQDLFPTNLSSLQMQSNVSDTVYLMGQASFKFTTYKIS